jgi:hypothetical protein
MGVNYWPGSCGVELWQHQPEAEVQHDLDVLVSVGLNSVRFFLRRQDFEAQPGQYDPVMYERPAHMLTWCAERGLYAQPSPFVGRMSGGILGPDWEAGRNLFADPAMVERSTAFARQATFARQPSGAAAGGDRPVPADQRGDPPRLSQQRDPFGQRAEPGAQRHRVTCRPTGGDRPVQRTRFPRARGFPVPARIRSHRNGVGPIGMG